MFGFIEKMFVVAMRFFGCDVLNVSSLSATPLKCVWMNNQEWKESLQIVNVNSDGPVFSPFSINTSNCSVSCNNITKKAKR